MVKIIFLADSHLGFDFPLRPKKEKRRRGMDFFGNFDFILNYAKTNKADLVIHGGDLFYRTRVPAPIIDLVYERIFNFAQGGIPMVIVPGNHESSKLPVSLFMQHPNIHYFTKAQVFPFRINEIDLDLAGFPCVRNKIDGAFQQINAELQTQLRQNSIKLLCMHQAIEGAQVGPSDFTFRRGADVIAMHDFPENYHLVLSGHIHRAQVLQTPNHIPVIYPGSIERTAFAEKDEEKGFYEISINTKNKISYKFIGLKTRPMVDVLLQEERYTKESLKKELRCRIKEMNTDSILRLKMKNPENLDLLNVKFLDESIPSTMNYQVAGF